MVSHTILIFQIVHFVENNHVLHLVIMLHMRPTHVCVQFEATDGSSFGCVVVTKHGGSSA